MILLTGATGFLGEFVLNELIKRKHNFICFVRKTSDVTLLESLNVRYLYGDLDDYESICNAMKGKSTLINLASLGFGHAPNIVNACEESGIRRGIFISTTSIFTKLNPDSKTIRIKAEELIQGSSLDYTILRPTMIYGTPKDRNMWRLISLIKKLPVIPILGSGKYLQQPVFVKDLANVIVDAYENDISIRQSYNISGKEPLSCNEVIDATSEALGKRTLKIHIPIKSSIFIVKIYEKLVKKPRIKEEQVRRLNENKDFSYADAAADLAYSPRDFKQGITLEVKSIVGKTKRGTE